jgi:hypothetical protein
MKLPHFWAKAYPTTVTPAPARDAGQPWSDLSCWGWSDVSAGEALQRGQQRADAIAQRLRQGGRLERYPYGERPLREEILDEWRNAAGATFAAVTRNSYGCEVLNTADTMFVDVDIPDPYPWTRLAFALKRLLGYRGPGPRARQELAATATLHDMVKRDPRCGVRIYRTRGGLRYLVTHCHHDPGSAGTLNAMAALGADPLYVKLCKTQECFRARLTPKPYRCGVPPLHATWPYRNAAAEQQARDWAATYRRASEHFATCAFVAHLGELGMDGDIARVVRFHDEVTRASSGRPLA